MHPTARALFTLLATVLVAAACSASTTVVGPTTGSGAESETATANAVSAEPRPAATAVETTATPTQDDLDTRELLDLLQAERDLQCYGDGTESEIPLELSQDFDTTEMVDVRTSRVTTVGALVTGDRPVIVWHWAACSPTSEDLHAEIEQFAVLHRDTFQVIGMGSGGGLPGAAQLVAAASTNTMPMLWDAEGHASRLINGTQNYQGVFQLLSFDLEHVSSAVFFNETGRQILIDASSQSPWAPD